jgi:hypothetical protein
VRLTYDWAYTEDWRAAANGWPSLVRSIRPHHRRAVRDVFLDDFDRAFDAIDGDELLEYPAESGGAELPGRDNLAGVIRGLYLANPPYRGPRVER